MSDSLPPADIGHLKLGASQRYLDAPRPPRPWRRLWRTFCKAHRPTQKFAPRIPFAPPAAADDAPSGAPWGERLLIEDLTHVLHRDGTITFRRHVVTQLFGAENLAAWDELSRGFDTRRDQHRIRTAKLYLPGEKPRTAAMKTYTVSAPGPRANTYGRTIHIQFFPLRPGAIVEFEEDYDSFQVGEFGPTIECEFFLETGHPCDHRRFTVAVSKPFHANYRAHFGAEAPTEREVGDYRVLSWERRDVPACEFDEWSPPARDYLPWVDVSATPSWGPIAERFRQELEPSSLGYDEVQNLVHQVCGGKSTQLERACAAYAYAARQVRYGRPPTEAGVRNSRSASRIAEDLRGDCKDKSALLVQLLRSMDMSAQIAVVLTSDAGRTPYLPSARFNHAIVKLLLDEQVYWLDAAGGPLTFGEPSNMNLGVHAMVLSQAAFQFEPITIRNTEVPTTHRVWTGRLTPQGEYIAHASIQLGFDSSARIRHQLDNQSPDRQALVLQSWLGGEYPDAIGSDFRFGDFRDLSKHFSYECSVRIPRVARAVKDIWLVQAPWSEGASLTGPFARAERKQPLIVPPHYYAVEEHHIDLPDGVTPFAVSDPVRVACDWGRYSCETTLEPGRLVCKRQFKLAGAAVPPERFVEFREFYQQCAWSDAMEIVLRRDEGASHAPAEL